MLGFKCEKTLRNMQTRHVHNIFVYLLCDETENTPYSVVRVFNEMDVSDSTVPHMFSYEQYRGDMYLGDYTGVFIGLRTIYQIFAKPKSFYLITSSHFLVRVDLFICHQLNLSTNIKVKTSNTFRRVIILWIYVL